MAKSDKVKLGIHTSSGNMITIITSKEEAETFEDDWISGTNFDSMTVSGKLNDADYNSIKLSYRRKNVDGVEIIDINSNF